LNIGRVDLHTISPAVIPANARRTPGPVITGATHASRGVG